MTALILLVALVYLVGWVMLVAAAFRQSTLWGLLVLFIPFAFIAFAVANWSEARKGFLIMSSCLGIAVVGGVIAGIVAPNMLYPREKVVDEPAAVKTDSAALVFNTPATPEPAYIPPPAAPKPATTVAAEPEPAQPVIKKVYVDNASHKFFPEDCQNLPPNAYKMARSLAIGQGYKPAGCP